MLLAAFGWCLEALAQSGVGTVFIDSRLLAGPAFNAEVVARVPADTRVAIGEGQGLWLRVRVEDSGQEGWIRRFDVRAGEGEKAAKKESGIGGLLGLFSRGGNQGGRVTNTIGIRGLDAVDINNARSDMAQIRRLDGFRADRVEAASLASDGGLSSRDVGYVEVAADERDSDGGGGLNFGF
ncbi:MAG: SH3 domain-containing protein [Gammaproteobacteria bacterium]|nr:SH3 domain-containing protein [Gammaproteobacteria bacterium]